MGVNRGVADLYACRKDECPTWSAEVPIEFDGSERCFVMAGVLIGQTWAATAPRAQARTIHFTGRYVSETYSWLGIGGHGNTSIAATSSPSGKADGWASSNHRVFACLQPDW